MSTSSAVFLIILTKISLPRNHSVIIFYIFTFDVDISTYIASQISNSTMGNPPNADAIHALKIHNDARASKHLKPLQWDDHLENQATEYAKVLAHASNGLKHSTNLGELKEGENLFAEMGNPAPPASQGAQAWINEGKNYHGQKIGEGNFGDYGHYSKISLLFTCGNSADGTLTLMSFSSVYVVEHDACGYRCCQGIQWLGLCRW